MSYSTCSTRKEADAATARAVAAEERASKAETLATAERQTRDEVVRRVVELERELRWRSETCCSTSRDGRPWPMPRERWGRESARGPPNRSGAIMKEAGDAANVPALARLKGALREQG